MEPPRKKQFQYDISLLNDAYFMVKNENVPVRRAARECGVPFSTLRDRLRGRTPLDSISGGKQALFTWQEEDKLARHLARMAAWGYGYTIDEVTMLGTDYAKQLKKVTGTRQLTRTWYYGFMKRNKATVKVSGLNKLF